MLGAPGAHERLGDVLRMFHVLHMDHGGGNLSTFTGKTVASAGTDLYSSLAAAMAGLYGVVMAIPFGRDYFELDVPSGDAFSKIAVVAAVATAALLAAPLVTDRFLATRERT